MKPALEFTLIDLASPGDLRRALLLWDDQTMRDARRQDQTMVAVQVPA